MSSVLQNLTFSSLVHSRPEVNLLVEFVSSRCKNDTVKSHFLNTFLWKMCRKITTIFVTELVSPQMKYCDLTNGRTI